MKILGIDPGSRRTGYGVVERRGTRLTPIGYGTIALGTGAMEGRLLHLFREMSAVVDRYAPQSAAIEGIFHARNASSALKLGHARGVALLVASLHELDVHEYAPTVVKRSVTSSGRAEKAQIQRMVSMILGLSERPDSDAADALAVAICHAQTAASLPFGQRR